jgi:hypothetical protein
MADSSWELHGLNQRLQAQCMGLGLGDPGTLAGGRGRGRRQEEAVVEDGVVLFDPQRATYVRPQGRQGQQAAGLGADLRMQEAAGAAGGSPAGAAGAAGAAGGPAAGAAGSPAAGAAGGTAAGAAGGTAAGAAGGTAAGPAGGPAACAAGGPAAWGAGPSAGVEGAVMANDAVPAGSGAGASAAAAGPRAGPGTAARLSSRPSGAVASRRGGAAAPPAAAAGPSAGSGVVAGAFDDSSDSSDDGGRHGRRRATRATAGDSSSEEYDNLELAEMLLGTLQEADRGPIDMMDVYEKVGHDRGKATWGWDPLRGCDRQGGVWAACWIVVWVVGANRPADATVGPPTRT